MAFRRWNRMLGLRLLAVLIMAWVVPSPAAEAELRRCMAANFPQRSAAFHFELQQSDRQGLQRQLQGQWYWRREAEQQAAVLRLTAPADLAGMAYLFLWNGAGQEVFIYLPSTGQARRVTGATAAQSLFGTGLSAFDLKFLIGGLQGGDLQPLAARGNIGATQTAWRYQPPPDPNILYDRVDLLIDATRCLPLKAEFYGGVPWKVLIIDPQHLRRQQQRWLIERARLDDLRLDTRTDIRFSGQQFDIELPPDFFKPKRFYRAPLLLSSQAAATRADAAGD